MQKIKFAIHAGAGVINLTDKTPAHLEVLRTVVQEGYQALANGVEALDVVEQAVNKLENYEGFNAGRGAVLTSAGTVELDAAIMDGKDRQAGALAAVQHVKNPVSGARAVMAYSKHVLMVGKEADQFCKEHQLVMVDADYFITEQRRKQLQQAHDLGHVQDLDALGTVGAVARDIHGHLAAATSTGGKANQLPGRVGDSPIIGAGTWADDNTCAISGTGDGEIFIRCSFAHTIHSYLQHRDSDLKAACQHALMQVAALGGEGGCIAISKEGEVVIMFNTSGMFRGWVDEDGQVHVAVVRPEV